MGYRTLVLHDAAPRSLPRGRLSNCSWAKAVTTVLAEASQPLHVRDIWSRMSEGGFVTGAADPLRSIVAIVLREPTIKRVAPNTYALNGTLQVGTSDNERGGGRIS
jgi:hypothetical protein